MCIRDSTYTGVTGSSSGSGTVGTFDIQVNAVGAVLSVNVVTIGSGHTAGDTITIQDSVLGNGGAANFTMDVNTISTAGDIDIADISIVDAGLGVAQGATITIADAVLGGGGGAAVTFEAGSVGAAGRITTVAYTNANAPQRAENFTNVAFTSNTASGDGNATFAVEITGASYLVTGGGGLNYQAGETFTIAGNSTGFGGATPANDISGTIVSVDANGAILTYTTTGTAFNGRTASNITGSNRQGSGATFTVELSDTEYTFVGIDTPGSGYAIGQQLVIPGTNLRGGSPANDATVTITSVDSEAQGLITGVTVTGTAAQPTGPYNNTCLLYTSDAADE